MFLKKIIIWTVLFLPAAFGSSSADADLDPRFCDPALTSPFYSGYRLRSTVSMSPTSVRSVFLYLDKCTDGKLIASIPFQLQEDPKNQWVPWNQFPHGKSFCSGISCFKSGRTRMDFLREQTSLQLTPGTVVGGLFYIAKGDGSKDDDLAPVAPFLREDITQVFLTSVTDELGKVYKQIHIPFLYTAEEADDWLLDGEPWHTRISGNENYEISGETKHAYRVLFDQVLNTLKRYLNVYNKRIQFLHDKMMDEKPIRKAMKSVTTQKLSQLDVSTVTLLKDKIDSLVKHRLNTKFLDFETLYTLSKVVPREELKKFMTQVDNAYSKIPIHPFVEKPINYQNRTKKSFYI